MAKQRKPPARRQANTETDTSLVLRSAESLGRVIGTLQRELDSARDRLAVRPRDTAERLRDDAPPVRRKRKATKAARSRTPSTTRRSAPRRTVKRTRSSR